MLKIEIEIEIGCGGIYRDRRESFAKKKFEEPPIAILRIEGFLLQFFFCKRPPKCYKIRWEVCKKYLQTPLILACNRS